MFLEFFFKASLYPDLPIVKKKKNVYSPGNTRLQKRRQGQTTPAALPERHDEEVNWSGFVVEGVMCRGGGGESNSLHVLLMQYLLP